MDQQTCFWVPLYPFSRSPTQVGTVVPDNLPMFFQQYFFGSSAKKRYHPQKPLPLTFFQNHHSYSISPILPFSARNHKNLKLFIALGHFPNICIYTEFDKNLEEYTLKNWLFCNLFCKKTKL